MAGSEFDNANDVIGDIGGGLGGSSSQQPDNALDAVSSGISEADKKTNEQATEEERLTVKALWEEYETAREFDKSKRQQYSEERKYAAGMADPSWASDANLIGSFIDILTSFLYAQDPDVSGKPAKQVGDKISEDNEALAETLEVLISKLWKLSNLKKSARRQVRSVLTVGIGWIKGLLWSKKRPQPQVERSLHDAESQMSRLLLLTTELREGDGPDPKEVLKSQLAMTISGLKSKLMLNKEYGISTDFVRAEDIQVSLDVASLTDYLDAHWCSEDIYVSKAELRQRFPVLTKEDSDKAIAYYQKNVPQNAKGDVLQSGTGETVADGAYSRDAPSTGSGSVKPVQFNKVVELWDRRDGMIKTMVDGVEKWAVPPYAPPQASLRFYPWFQLAFHEVDGHRHPQSLVGRLKKLQDEYSACRSNQRLTRERSIPGLIFNRGNMSVDDARKLEASVIAEMVGIQPTDITMPLQNIVMAKPLPTIDVRLWDTNAIRQDMEALSGVQEALQQSQTQKQPKTATEAQIEQVGFQSRTSAARDLLEEMLRELANYTAQIALQEIPGEAAQRLAGPMAFWPGPSLDGTQPGMDIQDLLTMVDVDIEAGTSGKPDTAADKANWGTLLPLLQKLMVQIRQVQETDPELAQCLQNLLKETLHRLDDRLDLDDFIAKDPPPPQPKPPPPPPNVSVALKGVLPTLDAAVIGANAAGLPPEAAMSGPAGAPAAIQPGAPDHPGAHIADGEIPLHPHMPQPLPAVQKTPAQGGETQKPKT